MKAIKTILAVLLAATLLTACSGGKESNKVTIWTSGEDYKNEYYLSELKAKFPDYDITLEYMNSSTIAAKILEEGDKTICDIVLSEEYGYMEKISDNLAVLDDFDYSVLPFLFPLILLIKFCYICFV